MAELLYGDRRRVRRAARAGSACTTCTAGSARSRSRSRRAPGELWGIELVEQAVADAIAAARRNEITNAHFFAGDTRLALPELVARAGRPDVVVVDPPRAGLSQEGRAAASSRPRPGGSCTSPATPPRSPPTPPNWCRPGWALRKVRPVDMFPQTHHIECVALLERTMTGDAVARGPPGPASAARTQPPEG